MRGWSGGRTEEQVMVRGSKEEGGEFSLSETSSSMYDVGCRPGEEVVGGKCCRGNVCSFV